MYRRGDLGMSNRTYEYFKRPNELITELRNIDSLFHEMYPVFDLLDRELVNLETKTRFKTPKFLPRPERTTTNYVSKFQTI